MNPRVRKAHADDFGNTERPQSRTYPSGRAVSVDYGTAGGVNDLISRVKALVDDDDTPLAEY